jgi:hypothetical protein
LTAVVPKTGVRLTDRPGCLGLVLGKRGDHLNLVNLLHLINWIEKGQLTEVRKLFSILQAVSTLDWEAFCI